MSEESAQERPERPERPAARHRSFEILIGFGVLLISAVSVFVAYNANRTQERILAASVWPSLVFGTSDISADGTPQLSMDLLNRGIGPARVRWAELLYEGRPMSGPSSLLAACCGTAREDSGLFVVGSSIQRRVIGADEWIQVMRVRRPDAPSPVYDALGRSLLDVRMRLCYCSVLDECWLMDSELPEPAPVRRCPVAPEILWESGS